MTSVFADPVTTAPLYARPERLASRTSALARAKTSGRHAAEVVADLIAEYHPDPDVVVDIGCGRGTSTITLARRLSPALLLAADASAGLLAEARDRFAEARVRVPAAWVGCDFHDLPLLDATADAAVAAFCLYHSPEPARVIGEIARILRPGGIAVLASKSVSSYAELDRLVEAAGLDPYAASRPSLYETAPGHLLPGLASRSLSVEVVDSELHTFTFTDLAHVGAYLATSPKYDLPPQLAGDAAALTAHLRAHVPDQPVKTSSIVTFVVARRTEATA